MLRVVHIGWKQLLQAGEGLVGGHGYGVCHAHIVVVAMRQDGWEQKSPGDCRRGDWKN